MKHRKIFLLFFILLIPALLAGCIAPRTPKEKCTILFEDNEKLYFSQQIYQVERFGHATITVGVPRGMRIASVNYASYSITPQTQHSEQYDFYTLTLHQVRYSAVIRLTIDKAYTTTYHPGLGEGESITVAEDSPHLYFNTLPYREQFQNGGYLPIGWNTRSDGSGISVGFGSRIDHTALSHMDLYMQWLPCTDASSFFYRVEQQQVIITGYHGAGDVVIPAQLDGLPVTGIASGAFRDLKIDTLVLPYTIKNVANSAFSNISVQKLYFFDSIKNMDDSSFQNCTITSLHIQAVQDPVYSGSYFDTFTDKMDYLMSLKDTQKIILFCGSSARFGYDSPMMEKAYPDYRVVNMGVYAYSNMRPQAELVSLYATGGDVLLSSPELDAIDMQFCASTDLDREFFCMVESNYDLLSQLDCTGYTNIFDAFQEFNNSRQRMEARSYQDSASYYDENGVRQLAPTYNLYGDYILYRPDNTDGKSFGIKRAYYSPNYVNQNDLDGLNWVYDAFAQKGVTVLFTYSPRSSISISDDSTPDTILALDDLLRDNLHATIISPINDSLMDPLYFYDTDNHLSTNGVQIHTNRVIEYLQSILDP